MTPTILIALAVLVLPLVPLQLHLDTRRNWVQETESDSWHGGDVAELPHPRQSLMPTRQTPSDLPDRWDTEGLAAVALGSRARHASDVVADTPLSYGGRHFAHGPVTQEFARIVGVEFGEDWKCGSCTVGRDGEDLHVSCPGCSCPCGALVVTA